MEATLLAKLSISVLVKPNEKKVEQKGHQREGGEDKDTNTSLILIKGRSQGTKINHQNLQSRDSFFSDPAKKQFKISDRDKAIFWETDLEEGQQPPSIAVLSCSCL